MSFAKFETRRWALVERGWNSKSARATGAGTYRLVLKVETVARGQYQVNRQGAGDLNGGE